MSGHERLKPIWREYPVFFLAQLLLSYKFGEVSGEQVDKIAERLFVLLEDTGVDALGQPSSRLAELQDRLKRGESSMLFAVPHLSELDGLVIAEAVVKELVRDDSVKPEEVAWIVSAKFLEESKRLQGVPGMERSGAMARNYFQYHHYHLIPVYQQYLLDQLREQDDELGDQARQANTGQLLSLSRQIRNSQIKLVIVFPEGTRNRTGSILSANQGIAGMMRLVDASYGISLNGVDRLTVEGSLLPSPLVPVRVGLSAPITKETIKEMTAVQALANKQYSLADLMVALALNTSPVEISPWVEGINPYDWYQELLSMPAFQQAFLQEREVAGTRDH